MSIKDLVVGDKVWGVIPVHHQGCHQEYVAVDKCYVTKKPDNISDNDAAAVLYAGLTAWSGIFLSGQLKGLLNTICPSDNKKHKKVLVLGATGGVGSLAVQMLVAEGVEVIATCGSDGVPLIQNLGAANVIDYTTNESDAVLVEESPYDLILDCAGKGSAYAEALPWTFESYVTFSSPLLKNFDSHGLLSGSFRNAKDLLSNNIAMLNGKGAVKWGYFMPAQPGIEYLKKLVENRKLLPIIDSVFKYSDLPKAYKKVQDGHLRGKVVVDYTNP